MKKKLNFDFCAYDCTCPKCSWVKTDYFCCNANYERGRCGCSEREKMSPEEQKSFIQGEHARASAEQEAKLAFFHPSEENPPAETDEQKQARAKACGEALSALLKSFKCDLDVGLRIFAGRTEPVVNIVPKD